MWGWSNLENTSLLLACNTQLPSSHFFSTSIFRTRHFPQSTPSHIHILTSTPIYAHTTPTNHSFPTRTPLLSLTRAPRLDSDISSLRFRRLRPWTRMFHPACKSSFRSPMHIPVLSAPRSMQSRTRFARCCLSDLMSMYVAPGAVSPFVCVVCIAMWLMGL